MRDGPGEGFQPVRITDGIAQILEGCEAQALYVVGHRQHLVETPVGWCPPGAYNAKELLNALKLEKKGCTVGGREFMIARESAQHLTDPEVAPQVKGMKRQKARKPTATGERVSSMTNHASAMCCIHVPTTEMSWPVKKRR